MFGKMKEEGILERRPEPELFLYRQVWKGHRQRGVAGLCHVDDYDGDIIKKHEKTRPDKEDDRTRLIRETRAQHGPVFMAYRDREEITRRMDEVERESVPLFDFVAEDGIRHTVWSLLDVDFWQEAFGQVPVAYVADGHHRSASAARVARECREANSEHTGEEEYNWFLSVLFPASELRILAYHRLVLDWGKTDPATFEDALVKDLGARPGDPHLPTGHDEVSLFFNGGWWRLTLPPSQHSGVSESLAASRLHEYILGPFLGIGDIRTDQRITFVGGIRGLPGLVGPVESGQAVVAFALPPVTMDDLMAIADAGEIMPPKSTWFEPKLRTGLFPHTF